MGVYNYSLVVDEPGRTTAGNRQFGCLPHKPGKPLPMQASWWDHESELGMTFAEKPQESEGGPLVRDGGERNHGGR